MTIIVGSLFLPHTVQFEVADSAAYEIEVTQEGSSAQQAQKEAREVRKHSLSYSEKVNVEKNDDSVEDNSASILPSLAQAPEFGSKPHKSNNSNHPVTSEQAKESAESFFYEKKLHRGSSYDGRGGGQHPSQNNPLVGNLQRSAQSQSPTPQYIQPRARPAGPQPQKSVVDVKKQVDDVGLPSLKINRSSSNLAGLGSSTSSSYTNLATLNSQTNPAAPTARRALNRPSPFTLHGNNSTSSIHEEASNLGIDSKDDWANDFNDISHARSQSKLAPYGGFSKPSLEDGILSHSNIFETAPWTVATYRKGNGSLIKAVDQALRDGKIHKRKWVGTIAMPSDAVPQKVIDDITKKLHDEYDSEAVFPNDDIFQGHYKSFCKQILWPTFHYQIPDDHKSKAFEEHSWEQYKALNQLMADKLVETYKRENAGKDPNDPENIIWIHDYHLLLAPKMVREQLPDAKIGFFLHVSFPSSEVFRCFAQRKSLLEGMLGANCISFQTEEYVRHFLQTCSRLLLADTNELGLTYDKNFVMTSTIPIGIDAEKFGPVTRTEDVMDWRQMIRERWGDQKLIVSRDKLDKLRGIKQKLLAYERFLLSNPEYIDNTVLIQICIGTSHDPNYESELLGIVSRINSLPENISISQPVVFLQQDIDFDQYVALQCEADVFVVSSMREGLNLTCHEFVIATSEKKSPLMISEFAGSSQILDCKGQGALLLNPWSLKAFAETFKKSLTMSKEEKERRWKSMYDMILTHDSNTWIGSCLKDINQAWAREEARHNGKMIRFTEEIFQQFYRKNQGNRLFFLNLETASVIGGQDPNTVVAAMKSVTNAAAVAGKSSSFSEPSTISKLLEGLLSDTSNRVYLVSVLRRSDLDRFYGGIPRLGLVAENGGYIKIVDSKSWLTLTDENEVGAWMPQVSSLIQSKVERLPGSFMEVEDCTVTFRPGKAFIDDRERSIDMMGDCIQHINDLFEESDGVHAFISKNVVIVQQNLLSLRALEFLVQFHSHTQKGVSPADIIDQFKARLALSPGSLSPVQSTTSMMQTSEAEQVKSLFVIGGTTQVDEPCFEYANSLAGDGYEVQTVTSFGAEANLKSSARYCVGGKNEVLVMLSKVGKEF